MSLKRSRRLRGLTPEESELNQCCFICQGFIDVSLLNRCVSTPCCGAFMHRRCHNQMIARCATCGNYRRPNVGHVSVVPDSDDEDDEFTLVTGTIVLRTDALNDQLNEYRNELRHLNTHYEGSLLWEELPFPIDVRT